MGGARHTSHLPALLAEQADLQERFSSYWSLGYFASADTIADRIELLQRRIDNARAWAERGKGLVTPSIQSQFETGTSKSAPV